MWGEKTTNCDAEWGFVAKHTGIGGAIQRNGVVAWIVRAHAFADQAAPLFGEDLAGQDQSGVMRAPIDVCGSAGVDDVLEKRRVAKQDRLLELGRQTLNNAQDLAHVVARTDRDNRIAARSEMPAATGREHTANPRTEREADDGEGAPLVGAEAIVKSLLETSGDWQLIRNGPGPQRRLAR